MNQTSDYDFKLAEELIAQTPLSKRDESRLLVLHKESGLIEHRIFKDVLSYFNSGDVLVLNDSRVLPARLFGIKQDTGACVEVLMLKEVTPDCWQCLCKPAKRIKVGAIIVFGDSQLSFECSKELEDGLREFKLSYQGILIERLEELGTMPLPPYIKEKLDNQERYQTVYSKVNGSAAAPTAGLHFTKELLDQVLQKGIKVAFITLHVGLGTFRPVNVTNIEEHVMHSEYYSLDEENASIINNAKEQQHKVVSVGTTSTRTLEAIYQKQGKLKADHGTTNIFIYPGFKFNVIDAQLTNFHLPKSTLMMLVSAQCSKDMIMRAYDEAIKEQYRFFSFGDSMLII